MILNNFVTTVATPLKNVGLLHPSICSPYPLTSTNVPLCWETSWLIPEGYMSSPRVKTLQKACAVHEGPLACALAKREGRDLVERYAGMSQGPREAQTALG